MVVCPVVGLVLLGGPVTDCTWRLGPQRTVGCTPRELANFLASGLAYSQAEAWFFWDGALGPPPEKQVASLDLRKRDGFHAGVALGLGGLPRLLPLVRPGWMLGSDADAGVEFSSWRLSFRAAVIRSDLLRQVNGPDPQFDSLEGAALDLGLRFLEAGAVLRHYPGLVAPEVREPPKELPWRDELRIVWRLSGKKWACWAAWRAWRRGWWSGKQFWQALRWLAEQPTQAWQSVPAYQRERRALHGPPVVSAEPLPKVSVLIPTLDRYSYLETLLGQLRNQTIPPHEVIVVDQTPVQRRRRDMKDAFPGLPLVWIEREPPGQCSSRNEGLRRATGDWVLFLDDDVEIPEDFIERHWQTILTYGADASCGTVCPPGRGSARLGISAVFPAGTTLLRKACLEKTGLFDLAYDHGQRADGDLGVRLYLSGALVILDPGNCILHHHAPRGGLRTHKARVVTRAESKESLWKRSLPSRWDFYLLYRYYGQEAAEEMAVQAVFSSFSYRGQRLAKWVRVGVASILLPSTMHRIRRAQKDGLAILRLFPQIPHLDDEGASPVGRVTGNG